MNQTYKLKFIIVNNYIIYVKKYRNKLSMTEFQSKT